MSTMTTFARYLVEQNVKITKNALRPDGIRPTLKNMLPALVVHGEEKLFVRRDLQTRTTNAKHMIS